MLRFSKVAQAKARSPVQKGSPKSLPVSQQNQVNKHISNEPRCVCLPTPKTILKEESNNVKHG